MHKSVSDNLSTIRKRCLSIYPPSKTLSESTIIIAAAWRSRTYIPKEKKIYSPVSTYFKAKC